MKKANEETANQERIKIERRYGDHYSYFVDANGLLSGEWGGYEELYDCGPNGEAMFEIYYNRFSRHIPINEFGYFYNKLSCKKYDGVIKLPKVNLYICEKNGRFGLIDEDEKSILHIAYKEIEPYVWGVYPGYGRRQLYMLGNNFDSMWEEEYKETSFFIVATETGKFLYNLSKRTESLVYDDITFSDWEEHPQIIFKSGSKYGGLDLEGNVMLSPNYELPKFPHTLFYTFRGKPFRVWAENGLFYGKIPSSQYEVCFKVGGSSLGDGGCFYVSIRGDKYGLISDKQQIVAEPVLDEILLYEPKNVFSKGCLHKTIYNDSSKLIDISFIIARVGDKYKLYNLQNGNLVLDNCDSVKYVYCGKGDEWDIIEFSQGNIKGFVLWNESIVSTANYEDISFILGFVHVKKDGKFGILRLSGEMLFPCIYDNILTSYEGKFTLIKDGKEEHINTNLRKISSCHSTYERPTYERYSGSYVQDELGWSDDDIDTVLDGDPSAYWNID